LRRGNDVRKTRAIKEVLEKGALGTNENEFRVGAASVMRRIMAWLSGWLNWGDVIFGDVECTSVRKRWRI
jgi:hypothetical protein